MPALPGKAIKLFFSTSRKTLSPRINLVSGYRGGIRLQPQRSFPCSPLFNKFLSALSPHHIRYPSRKVVLRPPQMRFGVRSGYEWVDLCRTPCLIGGSNPVSYSGDCSSSTHQRRLIAVFCVPRTQGEHVAQALGGLKTFFWGPGKQGWSSQMDDQGVAPL